MSIDSISSKKNEALFVDEGVFDSVCGATLHLSAKLDYRMPNCECVRRESLPLQK